MATRIPNEVVEEIRQRINIVDVISQHVQLRKQGRNLFGLCPFHEERTPSFSVNEEKQIFHCFSCGRGGNVFSFLMDLEDLSFPQAVAKVAPMAGIEIAEDVSETTAKPVDPQIQALLDLYADATKLYHHFLVNTAVGEQALDYLHERGLDDGTIDAYSLGFAPTGDVLLKYFEEKKIDYQLLRASELFVTWSDGTLHDRFNDRVLFTIRNAKGQPIAYSGRKLTSGDDEPKYINSPESPLFEKSRELFNLDMAKNAIRKSKQVILFEGFMDVIAAFQAGINNGVASMGTSLTPEQVHILNRMAESISVTYDADSAGQAATKRALDLIAMNSQLKAQVVHIPDNQDPDEFLRSHDSTAFTNVFVHNTEDPVAFNIRYLQTDRNMNNQAEVFAYIADVLPVIASVNEPLIRETYLAQLSDAYHISLAGLQQQIQPLLLAKIAQGQGGARQTQAKSRQQNDGAQTPWQNDTRTWSKAVQPNLRPRLSRGEQAEQILLAWILRDPTAWLNVTSREDFHFNQANYETLLLLASAYKDEFEGNEPVDAARFMDYVQRPDLTRIIASLDDIDDRLFDTEDPQSQINDYIRVIMQESPLEDQIKQVRRELSEASQVHNQALVAQLTIKLVELMKQNQPQRKS